MGHVLFKRGNVGLAWWARILLTARATFNCMRLFWGITGDGKIEPDDTLQVKYTVTL